MDKDSNAECLENFIQVLTEAGFNLQSEGDHFANTLSNTLHILPIFAKQLTI